MITQTAILIQAARDIDKTISHLVLQDLTDLSLTSLGLAGPIAVEEPDDRAADGKQQSDNPQIFSTLLSKVRDNVQLASDHVNDYLQYDTEKQPIVEGLKSLKSIAKFELVDANFLQNQTLEKYFEMIDRIFDTDLMNQLNSTDKLDTLEDKLNLLNKMRHCLVNLFQATLYQNLNDLIRMVATYINEIDSMIIKLDLNQEIDLTYLRTTIKDVLKFVQKFLFIFDEKDYKCEDINIF